jgi:hypothetical protein
MWGIKNERKSVTFTKEYTVGFKRAHLPKNIQLASNEPTMTFQNNHGILWGVNLDIQPVL